MDRQNKNAVLLIRVGEERLMKKGEKKLAGPLANMELPAEECSRRNSKREESFPQMKTSDDDNIMINGLYEDMKKKAEKRVEWRMLSLQ